MSERHQYAREYLEEIIERKEGEAERLADEVVRSIVVNDPEHFIAPKLRILIKHEDSIAAYRRVLAAVDRVEKEDAQRRQTHEPRQAAAFVELQRQAQRREGLQKLQVAQAMATYHLDRNEPIADEHLSVLRRFASDEEVTIKWAVENLLERHDSITKQQKKRKTA